MEWNIRTRHFLASLGARTKSYWVSGTLISIQIYLNYFYLKVYHLFSDYDKIIIPSGFIFSLELNILLSILFSCFLFVLTWHLAYVMLLYFLWFYIISVMYFCLFSDKLVLKIFESCKLCFFNYFCDITLHVNVLYKYLFFASPKKYVLIVCIISGIVSKT